MKGHAHRVIICDRKVMQIGLGFLFGEVNADSQLTSGCRGRR
jgi:hypothetical protein